MESELSYWLPYDLKFEHGSWSCLWISAGEHHFNEPFFDETIQSLKIIKGSKRFISCTNLSVLIDTLLPLPSIVPNAFIFHVSRCGSTLLSQSLSIDYKHIVVPEAPIFDQVLRMKEFDERISDEQIQELFRKVIAWYGQNRTTSYERYFIKLDSWHINFYEQLRTWYPETPFYFLSREPKAIVTSHIKRRGIHAIPGYINPSLLKVNVTEQHYQDFNFYTEIVIANFYVEYLEVLQKKHHLNYFYDYSFGVKEMLFNFYKKILKETTVAEKTLSRLATHSKDSAVAFSGDEKIAYEIKNRDLLKHYDILLNQIKDLS